MRVMQGAVGMGQVIAGAAQAVEGGWQAGVGVFAAPETLGASLLAVSGGVGNLTLGATSVYDGAGMLQAAISGNGNPQSLFGQLGQTYGGNLGGDIGEAANIAASVLAAGVGNSSARQLNFVFIIAQFAVNAFCG